MYAVAAAPPDRRPVLRESGAEYHPAGEPGPPPRAIPERLLAQLWHKRAARRAALYDQGGRRVRVLYPGRPSGGPGPDFRDALLDLEGVGLVRGDVEIHRRQGDWETHGHGGDPGYNGVVLHAALDVNDHPTRLASGQPVPVVSLAPLLGDPPPEDIFPEPAAGIYLWQRLAGQGYPRPAGAGPLAGLLDRAGDARFRAKSALFQRFLREQSPDQTLYEGIMEALGYRRNQQAFLNLAARAPYAALRHAGGRLAPEERAGFLEGWLLRLAGLGAPGGAEPPAWPVPGCGAPLHASQWHTAGVRPANHPRRRIAGAAELLARHWEPGLAAGLGRVAQAGSPRALELALVVHRAGSAGPGPVGASRARDIAVNVALPFLHGMAQLGQAPRAWQAAAVQPLAGQYARFGRLQENALTLEVARQLLAPWWPAWREVVNTARRQQGLLHLHHLLQGGG
jgi:hypothetical protein